jgi:ubiquinone/menaquinone biosynthesis C-methylase UbiE
MTKMTNRKAIQEHYTFADFKTRIEQALEKAGITRFPVDWSKLASLDQFHIRGLIASKELAEALNVRPDEKILDIGAGMGGPARFLSAEYKCDVTGIELNETFVQVANLLTEKTGQSDRVKFLQADATRLPFDDGSFDHAWMQHVSMNIPEKEELIASVCRVLKSHGTFALYEVLKGDDEELFYPVPWASTASLSFLASEAELADAIKAGGLNLVSFKDMSGECLPWLESREGEQTPSGPPAISLGNAIGPAFKEMVGNVIRNLRTNRIRVCQIIAQKP